MSNIETYINQFKSATFGEDVRDTIVNLARQMYNDVTSPTLTLDGFRTILNEMAASGALPDSLMSYLGVLTEDTSNKFNLLTTVVGRLNTTTGEINTEATTYVTSDWIPVTAGDLLYFDNCSDKVFYNTSKTRQAAITASGSTAYTVPSGGGYVRASCTTGNRNVAKINVGTRVVYRPGRTAVDYNLRDDVYRKAEVDALIADFDISLTAEQKAALIALLDK